MLRIGLFLLAAAAGFFVCEASRAQPQSSSKQPEFEVASVKPSAIDDTRTLLQVLPGGGLRASGATLKFLITLAYEVRSFQIVGGPGWIGSDHFDVVGKANRSADSEEPLDPTKVTAAQLQGMQDKMRPKLQGVLAERFRLTLHRETREQPAYALVVGKSGSKLQRVSGNFDGLRIGRGQLTGNGATLEMLTTALANQLGRPVLDRTRLAGAFDFKLEWTPLSGDAPSDDPNGPSIFTALQEQLGLKLESTKGPAEVLVIDHVERPSEN